MGIFCCIFYSESFYSEENLKLIRGLFLEYKNVSFSNIFAFKISLICKEYLCVYCYPQKEGAGLNLNHFISCY